MKKRYARPLLLSTGRSREIPAALGILAVWGFNPSAIAKIVPSNWRRQSSKPRKFEPEQRLLDLVLLERSLKSVATERAAIYSLEPDSWDKDAAQDWRLWSRGLGAST